MRKLILCVMFVAAVFAAGIAGAADSVIAPQDTGRSVPVNPFSGFGFYPSYVTSGSVSVLVDGLPDYSEVSVLKPDSVMFGGLVGNTVERTNLPVGTLTFLSGDSERNGKSYRLIPYDYYNSYPDYYGNDGIYNAGDFVSYMYNYSASVLGLDGEKLLWNVYTSPDVIEGASVVKRAESYDNIVIGKNDIVPFVKLVSNGDRYGRVGRIDLYFVRSGDWSTPVAVNYPKVTLSVSGYYSTFTDFNKSSPVRNSMENIYLNEDYSHRIEVSCYDSKGVYTWYFYTGVRSESIGWQELSLNRQPLKLKPGDVKRVGINLPSAYRLPADFTSEDVRKSLFTVMNESVVKIQDVSLSYDLGAGEWSGDIWKGEKSTLLAFTLLAGEEGVTTLKIDLPKIERTYYRGIHVTDDRGNISATGKPGVLKPAFVHSTSAKLP